MAADAPIGDSGPLRRMGRVAPALVLYLTGLTFTAFRLATVGEPNIPSGLRPTVNCGHCLLLNLKDAAVLEFRL